MANKSLFASLTDRLPRANADAVNEAGGRAYKLEPKHALISRSNCANESKMFSVKRPIECVVLKC